MYRLNRRGASTEPCGTPFLRNLCLLLSAPMCIMKLRDAIIVMMKFTRDLSGITLLSFNLRPLCQTVSYAAERSMKMAPHLSFRSNPASISSVSSVTWSVVHLPSQKPACSSGRNWSTRCDIRFKISLSVSL